MRDDLTIGIAGAGGDGVVALATYLQKFTAVQGYFSQLPRYYGPQIRGGASGAKLSLDARSSSVPRDSVDIMVCFNWEHWLELKEELTFGANTLLFYETKPPNEITLPDKSGTVLFGWMSHIHTVPPMTTSSQLLYG